MIAKDFRNQDKYQDKYQERQISFLRITDFGANNLKNYQLSQIEINVKRIRETYKASFQERMLREHPRHFTIQ